MTRGTPLVGGGAPVHFPAFPALKIARQPSHRLQPARVAQLFLEALKDGVRLHLEKRLPLAAGLGGGSGNAAVTLLGLNEIFGEPLSRAQLETLAASLGLRPRDAASVFSSCSSSLSNMPNSFAV